MDDRKFTLLRKRLDQLGYRQALTIEAIPLVEKLFSDLVHTTESFKNYKQKRSQITNDIKTIDHIEPYRADNAKLVKQNNELHLKLMKSKEEKERVIVDSKNAAHKLENENQDLRFLNSQYVYKIKSLEKESELKNKHIQTLQEKNLNAVVETPGGRQKNIPFRRQRMDLENTLAPSESGTSINSAGVQSYSDPYVADLLGLADNRIEDMKNKIEILTKEKEVLEKNLKRIKTQVENRDEEIKRLNDLLEGGRPVEAVLKDTLRGSSDRVLSHLNIQVDYLQQANHDLEKQLHQHKLTESESITLQKDLQERNDELCTEIAALNKVYKNLAKEKKKGDGEVDDQIETLRLELEEKQQNIFDLQANLSMIKKERDGLIEENQHYLSQVTSSEQDRQNILELLQRIEKEKKRLMERNSKLTISERELAMDLERLKISKGVTSRKTASNENIEFLVKNVEDDRDYYKNEFLSLQKFVHEKYLKNGHTSSSDNYLSSNQHNHHTNIQKDFIHQQNIHSPPTKDKDSPSEVNRLRKERNKLQEMLASFQSHLTEIQTNVRNLTSDRDNVQLLYEQSIEEVKRLRSQLSRARSPSSSSRKVTSILDRAELERDEAMAELRKIGADVKKFKSLLKAAKEDHMLQKDRHAAKQRNLQELLSKLESDNNCLKKKLSSSENITESLQTEIKQSTDSTRRLQCEKVEKETEISKVRLLLEQSERNCSDLRGKLEYKYSETSQKDDENHMLEQRSDHYEKECMELKNEILHLKTIISTIDREKDELQQEMDDKAVQLVQLDEGLKKQEKADTQLKCSLEELEESLRYREQELLSKEREINSLSKQIHSLEEELTGQSQSRDITIKENRRIQDDLATLSTENQVLHKNLQDIMDESNALKQQVEEYASQLRRVQELLQDKDLEKEDLLLQFKTLSNKAGILENNMHQSEGQAVTFKQDLIHKEQQVAYLEDRCVALEHEIEQHISREESYENQLATLTQSVANMDAQLRNTNDEKETILEDLFAVRELCVKLDKTREELTTKITSKTNGVEQLGILLNETKAECEIFKKQADLAKEKAKSLEEIIASSREKQYYDKRSLEENQGDVERYKHHMITCDSDRKTKEDDISDLRRENMSLEGKISTLKKDLTSEKYERERMRQELRRASHSPLKEDLFEGNSKYTSNEVQRQSKELDILRGSYISTSMPHYSQQQKTSSSFSPLQVSFTSDNDNDT